MASLNKILLIGNTGTDPEMRFTPNGHPVTTFRMATSRVYNTAAGEKKQETEWFTIETWGKQAETCNQYLTKGKRVFVEGRLRTRAWEGQDGQKRTTVEVVANRVMFLDRQAAAAAAPTGEEPEAAAEIEPEDLPF